MCTSWETLQSVIEGIDGRRGGRLSLSADARPNVPPRAVAAGVAGIMAGTIPQPFILAMNGLCPRLF